MRNVLPAMSRLYGLTWADVESMPRSERTAYLHDLAAHLRHTDEPG